MTLCRSLILFVLSAWCVSAAALEIPPKPTAWVTDRAGILSSETEQALNERIEAFAKGSGTQILIMTWPSLEGEVPEDYTIRVAEQWKVKGDRALILFVFQQERVIRMEVGYGLEGAIPDAYARRIISEVMTPEFRRGDYDAGVRNAVEVIIARVSGQESPIPFDGAAGEGGTAAFGCADLIFLLGILFFFLVILGPLISRTGMRGCGCIPIPFFFPGSTFGGRRGGFGGGGGGGWNVGGGWGGGGFGSFGGGGATGGW